MGDTRVGRATLIGLLYPRLQALRTLKQGHVTIQSESSTVVD